MEPYPKNFPDSSDDLIFRNPGNLQIFGDTNGYKELFKATILNKTSSSFRRRYTRLQDEMKGQVMWDLGPGCATKTENFAVVTDGQLQYKMALRAYANRRVFVNKHSPILVIHRLWYTNSEFLAKVVEPVFTSIIESGLHTKLMEYAAKTWNFIMMRNINRDGKFNKTWNMYSLAVQGKIGDYDNVGETPVPLNALRVVWLLYAIMLFIAVACLVVEQVFYKPTTKIPSHNDK
ncbi:unnamed protein product [Orchesella dallaii]|uniref:Uncharacterized protein n=1 Tax=Orchesella dallaii TaxID=48710 RepID=A0ABP1QH51_9HEXA